MSNEEEIINNENNTNINNNYSVNSQPINIQLNSNTNANIKDTNENGNNNYNDNKTNNQVNNESNNSLIENRKKDTMIDDVSMNIELKNQNEFINMDHFDESSKIGFGINDFDEKSRIKVLSNAKSGKIIHTRKYSRKEIDSEDEDEIKNEEDKDEEDESSKNSFNANEIDFFQIPIDHLNQIVNQYCQLSKLKTFKKFIKQKMPYYINEQELLDQFMHKKPQINRNNKNDDYTKLLISNKGYNSSNEFYKQQSSKDFLSKSIQPNNVSSYFSPHENRLSPQKNILINSNANMSQYLFPNKSQMNFKPNPNPNSNANPTATKQLVKDNVDLKDQISLINNKILEIQTLIDKKSKELQKKNEKVSLYLDKYDSLIQENEALKTKIDNMKIDINIEKNDNYKKTEKINEIQFKINDLDQDHRDLLKKIQLEATIQKETRQNFELFKGNYIEIKNQYDLLNIKYQSISDENFNYKRDLLLYEKELKNKNEMIDKLRNNLLDNAKYVLSRDSNTYSILDTNNSTTIANITIPINDGGQSRSPSPSRKNNFLKNAKNNKSNHSLNMSLEKKNEHSREYSNKINLTKNQQVKFIEIQISKLNKERDDINNELNKLPQYPKKRNMIEQKKEMESKIDQLGSDLVKMRIEMKRLKEDET